jgi:hypothetical protein
VVTDLICNVGHCCQATTREDMEDLVFIVVICRMCRLVISVIMSYERLINPITNPDPLSSHLHLTVLAQTLLFCTSRAQ